MRIAPRPARAAFNSSSVGLILHLRVRSSAIGLRISHGGPNDTFDAAFGANTGTHRKSLIRDTENVKKWKKGLVEVRRISPGPVGAGTTERGATTVYDGCCRSPVPR